MLVGGSYREPDSSPLPASLTGLTDGEALLTALALSVVERFERLTGLPAVTATVDPPGAQENDSLPAAPAHPLCAEPRDAEYCRQSWRSHLAELAIRPEAHWHRCKYGKRCAVVPVTWHRHCIAVCRLVCPESMEQEAFEHHVELLAVLVENFTARHSKNLSPPALPNSAPTQAPVQDGAADAAKPQLHQKVSGAIQYIEEHLQDAELNAGAIARHLEINATYLAHLFKKHTGVRMNRYIAGRRVDVAKRLLATTSWQVKRIAHECGYANPDWFGHVFHAHTGMKPGEYRLGLREEPPPPAPN